MSGDQAVTAPQPESIINAGMCADAVRELIATYPLALIVSVLDNTTHVTPAPLLLHRDRDRDWLIGHLARRNPHLSHIRQSPRATVMFLGPNAYVSPSWLNDRTQAPTWHYALATLDVEIEVDEGTEATLNSLHSLVASMERQQEKPWDPSEMGPRLDQLARAVAPIRALVLNTQTKMKLGQKERPDVFHDALLALSNRGHSQLVSMMSDARRRHL